MSPAEQQELQAALLSVYYHSLGRQLELRGAPVVLLPPVVRPIPLQSALDIVREQAVAALPENHPPEREAEAEAVDRTEEVLWTLLRSTPPPPLSGPETLDPRTLDRRYAAPLRSFAEKLDFSLEEYDWKRATYRAQSGVFAAALTAYARGQGAAFEALMNVKQEHALFDKAVGDHKALGGDTPQQYLETIASGDRKKIGKELARLQDDVGLTLNALVNDFADCMAFLEVLPNGRRDEDYRIFPTSAVVVQDSQNLTTTVTVTTLVQSESLKLITETLDPQNWQESSDAFKEVCYVEDASTGFRRVAESPNAGEWCAPDEEGNQADQNLLLREIVTVPSGLSPTVIARFENILRITLHESGLDEDKPDAGRGSAQLTYSLYRSCNSRYLWDERPGGILLDQGYIKVRPLGNEKTWRVTVRKVLRFADRTPASWADTPLQFGQSLNYLAPAALSWWLQSDMYNLERSTHRKRQQQEGSVVGD